MFFPASLIHKTIPTNAFKHRLFATLITMLALAMAMDTAIASPLHMWKINSNSIAAADDYKIEISDKTIIVKKRGEKEKSYVMKNTIIAIVPSPALPVIAIFTSGTDFLKNREEDRKIHGEYRDLDIYIEGVSFVSLKKGNQLATDLDPQPYNSDNLFDIWSPDGIRAALQLSRYGPVAVYDFEYHDIEKHIEKPTLVTPEPLSCQSATFYECFKWLHDYKLEIITVQCGTFSKNAYLTLTGAIKHTGEGDAARLLCN